MKLQVTWGCDIPTMMNVRLSNMNGYKWMCQLRHIVASTRKKEESNGMRWKNGYSDAYINVLVMRPLRKIVHYFQHGSYPSSPCS